MTQFITFEGIDGSGKSTVSRIVYKEMKKLGYKVELTLEPTDTWIGRCVQECIETKTDAFVTAYAFIADRVEHCKKIKEWITQGKTVICDRYADSTYAYQAAQMQDIIDEPMKWLQEMSEDIILKPDKTFLFIAEPEICIKRIQNRDNLIPFEKINFLKKVQKNYLKLSSEKKFIEIDATKPINKLVEECLEKIIH